MHLEHIQADWNLAEKALRAAQILQKEGLFPDAISRAYYAVMHAARAALLAHDTIAESHSAVRRLFGEVLVKPGLIEKEWSSILTREQIRRISADYDAQATWDAATTQPLVQNAEAFVGRMRDYLSSIGISIEGP